MALGIFSPSGPRSCKNNKFVQIDHTHQEIVCFAKFFNNNNVTLMDLVNYINDKYYHLPIYDIPFYVRKRKIEK